MAKIGFVLIQIAPIEKLQLRPIFKRALGFSRNAQTGTFQSAKMGKRPSPKVHKNGMCDSMKWTQSNKVLQLN